MRSSGLRRHPAADPGRPGAGAGGHRRARIPQAPEVPTLAEAGFPDAASYAWNGLIAPAAMPAERVARLAEAAAGAGGAGSPAVLEAAGFEVVASGPAEASRTVAAETARWSGLIPGLGIKAEA